MCPGLNPDDFKIEMKSKENSPTPTGAEGEEPSSTLSGSRRITKQLGVLGFYRVGTTAGVKNARLSG